MMQMSCHRREPASNASSSIEGASTRSGSPSGQHPCYTPTGVELPQEDNYEYPVPVIIRHTFLEVETAALRSPSLEAFVRERRAISCPKQRGGDSQQQAPTPLNSPTASTSPQLRSSPRRSSPTSVGSSNKSAGARLGDMLKFPGFQSPTASTVASRPDFDMQDMPPITLALAPHLRGGTMGSNGGYEATDGYSTMDATPNALDMSPAGNFIRSPVHMLGSLVLGSEQLPTIGSISHHIRRCKPCAFILKGCQSGVECKFCHLCESGEKKRRKKERAQLQKEAKKNKSLQGRWNGPEQLSLRGGSRWDRSFAAEW